MNVAGNTVDLLASIFAPKPRLSTWRWAEQNVVLSNRITQQPGPYRTDFIPYVRAPQEDFDNPRVRTIVMCWAARSSKTETINNMLRKNIAVDHESFIMAQPSQTLARSWSEARFQPSVRDCPATAAEIPDNSDHFKLTEMHFKHCTGWVVGAGSAANLKGRGVTIICGDEIDTWKEGGDKETGSLQQLQERNRERWNRKTILTSTPTVEAGQIWQEFLTGDQRYYFVPCPICGEMQRLFRTQLQHAPEAKQADGTWDAGAVNDSTFYECEKCGKRIGHECKAEMLRKGEWRATAKAKEPGRVSYHLNALYSPWTSWGEVQVAFLKANAAGREELQKFVNSWLAEPFYALGDPGDFFATLDAAAGRERVEAVPKEHVGLMAIDVQQDCIFYEVGAHNKDRDAMILEYGQLPDFPEIEPVILNRWKPFAIFVDSAYAARQNEVLNWCYGMRQRGILAVPVLGNAGLLQSYRWAKVPIEGGMFKGKYVEALRFRPSDWKDEWLRRVKNPNDPPKWTGPVDATVEWKKHHASETPHTRKLGHGRSKTEWVLRNTRTPNHWFDNTVTLLMGFEAVRTIAFDMPSDATQAPPSPLPEGKQVNNEAQEIEAARTAYRESQDNNRDQVW